MVRLRGPRSLGFRFAPPCEPGGHPQVWMLPLSRCGRVSASWFQAQAPGMSWRWVLTGFRRSQDAFHRLLSPHGSHSVTRLATRTLRRRPDACSGQHATPDTFRPYQSPLVFSPGPSCVAPSAGDFPRDNSRFPSSGFHLTVLGTHGGTATLCPASPVACSGLRATPASEALQSRLTSNLGQAPDYAGVLGSSGHWR